MALIKGEAKTGFWVAMGVLAALTVWHIAATKFPQLQNRVG